MSVYHSEYLPDTHLWDMLGVWSYGLPEENADAAAKEAAAASVLAAGLLTQEQLDTLSVSCNYYTASCFVLPFTEPWWVIRYSDHTMPVCEVWLNSELNDIHAVDLQRMTRIAEEALMAQEPQMGSNLVSLEEIRFFDHYVLYRADEGQWCYVVDSGLGAHWLVDMLDDAALTVVQAEPTNG